MVWEGLNRRRFPRANFPCMIKIFQEEKVQDAILMHTENLSIGGVAVIIKKAFELFAGVVVDVDLMDGGDPISCQARVVWVVRRKGIEEHKPFFYDVGLEFVDLKEEARRRIEAMVAHLVNSGRESAYH
ncbi:MAG: PilZ domain-containing protein [Candidatus Omnitrophota bacterium]